MSLRVVQKLAYHCSLKGTAELMRLDRLLPMRAARRLCGSNVNVWSSITPTFTAVPLRESKRTTSSPFMSRTHLAVGAVSFGDVRLASCPKGVDEVGRVATRRHHRERVWLQTRGARTKDGVSAGKRALQFLPRALPRRRHKFQSASSQCQRTLLAPPTTGMMPSCGSATLGAIFRCQDGTAHGANVEAAAAVVILSHHCYRPRMIGRLSSGLAAPMVPA